MMGRKTVANVVAGFNKVMEQLQDISVLQDAKASGLADQLVAAEIERDEALRILGNFQKMMNGKL